MRLFDPSVGRPQGGVYLVLVGTQSGTEAFTYPVCAPIMRAEWALAGW